ncbi:MAG TPA: ROK family transcriptional regulator [Ktedonobacterales bacterium]|nr:ROK family transcriptional regulator [Ktedonobacterales bacterium]
MSITLDGPAVPGSLRRINRLAILRLLRQMGPISIPALAKAKNISRPTVAKLVDELERDGLAMAVGSTQPAASGGKPAVLYQFNAAGVRCGAIFLRVDSAQFAVMDGNGRALALVERTLGPDTRPAPVIDVLIETFREMLATLALTPDQLIGIGVGVPGLASQQRGIVHLAPHMPEWIDVPLGEQLALALDTQVWVGNDSHVQALVERQFGLGRDGKEFITVQSGIGLSAGYFLRDALYRGYADTAGEIGHMTVQEDGPPCSCGNQGCWETLASTTALVESACRQPNGGYALPEWLAARCASMGSLASGSAPTPHEVASIAEAIFAAAQDGQPEAQELVRRHAYHFGVGVANIVNALNPGRIIIWGASTAGGALFLEEVRAVVRRRSMVRPREVCEIMFSQLGQNVGLLGAASLALTALFDGAITDSSSTSRA